MIFYKYKVYDLDIATTMEYAPIDAFLDPQIHKLLQMSPPDEDLQFSKCRSLSSVRVSGIPSTKQILFKDCPKLSKVRASSGTLSFISCPALQSLSLTQEFADLSSCTSLRKLSFSGSQLILPNVKIDEIAIIGCISWNECNGLYLYLDLVSLNSCPRVEFKHVNIDCERFSVVDLRNVEHQRFWVPSETVLLTRSYGSTHFTVLFLDELYNLHTVLKELLLAAFLCK